MYKNYIKNNRYIIVMLIKNNYNNDSDSDIIMKNQLYECKELLILKLLLSVFLIVIK